jgi:hypothetical protein
VLSRSQRLGRLAGAAASALLAAAAFAWTPERLPLPRCAFKAWTGLDCLTCGLTRSLHAAVRGDLAEAVVSHPIGPILLAVGVVAAGIWGIEAATGKPIRIPNSRAAARWALAATACIWVGNWLVRLALELR